MEALLRGAPLETNTPFISDPNRSWPVHRVKMNDPAIVRWQKEPRLRRASAISYFMVEAAEQALAGLDASQRAETGLVVAFSTGCLAYSCRFFGSVITQGQKAASPALFPETVFNSPVSHVAATLRLDGAAYALAGDETAWIAALKTASLWLEQERVKQVLVMGAEEFDPASLDAYHNARWLRRKNGQPVFIPSEGAAALLLRKAEPGDGKIIAQLEDGFIYRSKTQAIAAGKRCLQQFDSGLVFSMSAQRNWLGEIERTLTEGRCRTDSESPYLGEAVTASAAWNTLRALSGLGEQHERLMVPVWGNSHQCSALELRKS
jgi:3-oxoacyl-[acyl-carrier-protein] synthase III